MAGDLNFLLEGLRPSVGRGQPFQPQQPTFEELVAQLQPPQLPVPEETSTRQRVLMAIGSALLARGGNTQGAMQAIQGLQQQGSERRQVQRQNELLKAQTQQQQDALRLDELIRQQGLSREDAKTAEALQAQLDAEQRRLDAQLGAENRQLVTNTRTLLAEADLDEAGHDFSNPAGIFAAQRAARSVLRQREIDDAAEGLDARQSKALAEANLVGDLLLNGEEGKVQSAADRLAAGESIEDILRDFDRQLRFIEGGRGIVAQLARETLRGDLLELRQDLGQQQAAAEGRGALEGMRAEFEKFEQEDKARKRRIDRAKKSSGLGAAQRGAGFQG